MELANKGTWFDGEWQAAIEDENKIHRKMQQGYGTRNLIEKYKDKRIKIHRRKKKEWINMELENMELLRKQHECRKFYKEINMARKQVKPRVNICMSRNEEGSLISNGQEILKTWVRYFDKLLNRRKDNKCVTLTTTSSKQISKGNTQDTTDAPTTKETETALKNVVCFLLGNSSATEFYMPTFRNTLSVPSSQAGRYEESLKSRALKKLKIYDDPETDNIPAELLKFGGERLKQWLKHIFS